MRVLPPPPGVTGYNFKKISIIFLSLKIHFVLAISVDPDEMLPYVAFHMGLYSMSQSEMPRPIPRNSVESDLGCLSRIYVDNAGDNVMLMLHNVTLASQKRC